MMYQIIYVYNFEFSRNIKLKIVSYSVLEVLNKLLKISTSCILVQFLSDISLFHPGVKVTTPTCMVHVGVVTFTPNIN